MMGEFYALLTAGVWAIGVIFFRLSGLNHVTPVALNLFKNTFAFVLLLPTIPLLQISFFSGMSLWHFFLIAASGMVGIGAADTLFFKSLNILGASRSAILESLYSPFVIVSAFFILGEKLNWLDMLGGLFILSGILLVSTRDGHLIVRKQFWLGVIYGVLGLVLMAVAIVAIKPFIDLYPVSWTMVARLAGGILFLIPFSFFCRDKREIWKIFKPQTCWKVLVPGSFFGAYLSLFFWIAGMKYTQTNIASLFNQTSTIFIVILAAIFLKEKLTPRKTIAVLLAVIGGVCVWM